MSEIQLEKIKEARDECARIIALYGDKFLPIFQRLETEIEQREHQNKLLAKALKIGTQSGTHFGTQFKQQFYKASQ
ncbi:hypothetical protein BFP97_06435 [Roseivirga sp. 4D4]|uniref:hypothetical protein n=1 Tax=Roseivirga sp. 4D4 TaxID=1889784 RepID=UPI000852A9D6|nr:hypothetical protein [Roseivirga sp. 4D4]OEK01169.1 hypothetical protein BFP97_06435 [Roseivirga sp. 4D4]